MTMNSASHNSIDHNSIAERFGRWLGRGWRGYARCEQQISGWFVEQGIPVKGAFALLWIAKLALLGLLLYVAFWLALLLIGLLLVAQRRGNREHDDLQPSMELRHGEAGFGLYSSDGYRIDPHDPNDPYDD
ncbi:DUF3742 family protein [Dickeya chrysanthemi]|nr:DUF3742 family protein [Dickeya chrysanthemi]WJM87666.1 DUF3742 family protein [Dickeya chrysanthemi]